jgi:tetratricopeptide (TPR) repeat protein
MGDWKQAFAYLNQGRNLLHMMAEDMFLNTLLNGYVTWALTMAGRYTKAEQGAREGIVYLIHNQREDRPWGDNSLSVLYQDLGFALGHQRRFQEAEVCFQEALQQYEQLGSDYIAGQGFVRGYQGAILVKKGELQPAEQYFLESMSRKATYQDYVGIPEILNWQAELNEVRGHWTTAHDLYQQSLSYEWTGRRNFESGAYTGLVRVHHATADYAAIPDVLAEAESLAQQYEYNDHLASLRLSQGHIAWDGHIPAWGSGFDAALGFYQQSLIYALRYNRFLLDEVLWGGNVTTPLHPIIPHCQQRGDEGQRMLAALLDWWQTGMNDSGTSRPDTISLVPEGVPLLEAERIARANEPGDGSPQTEVVTVLMQAIGDKALKRCSVEALQR